MVTCHIGAFNMGSHASCFPPSDTVVRYPLTVVSPCYGRDKAGLEMNINHEQVVYRPHALRPLASSFFAQSPPFCSHYFSNVLPLQRSRLCLHYPRTPSCLAPPAGQRCHHNFIRIPTHLPARRFLRRLPNSGRLGCPACYLCLFHYRCDRSWYMQ